MAPDQPGDEDSILRQLTLRTKAVIISSEFTHGGLAPGLLREVLVALAPTAEEQASIVQSVAEDLKAARYPNDDIVRLIGLLTDPNATGRSLVPERASAGRDANVLITRKVRSPSLMPFERFEFKSEAQTEGGERPESVASPGVADKGQKLKFIAGGETASLSVKSFKGIARPKGGSASGQPPVLVADDDARSRMMYRAKLEESGYDVIEAKDGIEAWNHIKSGAVQCAVMDMKMPGYHGLEVLGRMVDANLILPVVVVSAFDQLANEFVVATYPKLTFLIKPAPPEQVAAAVDGFLAAGRK
jgi:CheY-like chemotaxis protein